MFKTVYLVGVLSLVASATADSTLAARLTFAAAPVVECDETSEGLVEVFARAF